MKGFQESIKEKKNLSIFFTAGFPKLNSMQEVLKHLNNTQVDFIEVGIPFSDPLADGPVIQNSSTVALSNGMTLSLLFKQLQVVKNEIQKPILLMGYLNSLLSFGLPQFYKLCKTNNIRHIIIPDMPIEEYKKEHQLLAKQNEVQPIFIITPTTSDERIRLIDKMSQGFIYLVSSNSTTGNNKKMSEKRIRQIHAMKLRNPIIVGFGIKNREDYLKASKISDGAIIGTAFINCIEKSNNLKNDISSFINQIKDN